ncbi:hypothetical protein B0T25DRAFT_632557 [Lasiosphaeria hispida]|uniref:Uncharacterized protein n=1 Tax=Lasiosphaeria hispida TaxID=260671 RepID=A0AAJ0MC80_9PEZI|nr:hypothetical protein B0T25DRAFT_632557 [Lasiosphaeria hispida]
MEGQLAQKLLIVLDCEHLLMNLVWHQPAASWELRTGKWVLERVKTDGKTGVGWRDWRYGGTGGTGTGETPGAEGKAEMATSDIIALAVGIPSAIAGILVWSPVLFAAPETPPKYDPAKSALESE